MSTGRECQLGPITGVTISVPDVAGAAEAYCRCFGYRQVGSGKVSLEHARMWNRTGCAGARYVLLSPAGADDFVFRLVETHHAAGYRAFRHYGWNAAELIVRDVDQLATRLCGSAFHVLGPPQDLSFTDAIRAMQVRGPAGEILYLTQFKRELPALPHPPARCDVDRAFIVIVAGPSLDALISFYTERFAVPETARMESRVKAMSEAFGLSPEHRYAIAALPLRGRSYIEADQMPPEAQPPDAPGDQLPPGIAIVSFATAPDARPASVSCTVGPAGEMIELIG